MKMIFSGGAFIILIYPQKVTVKWTNMNKSYFISKSYVFTKLFDAFEVDMNDLQEKSDIKILLNCDNCNENYPTKYCSYTKRKNKDRKDLCVNCKKRGSGKHGDLMKNVELKFKERGLILLSSQHYENYRTKFKFICEDHKEQGVQEVQWQKFNLRNYGCKACNEEERLKKRRIDFKEIEILSKKRGYPIITKSDDYLNNKQKLKFMCELHDFFEMTWSEFRGSQIRAGYNCPACKFENQSGEKHHNWKGGISSLNIYLRGKLSRWIKKSLKEHNGRCFVTGNIDNVEVHHPYNFYKILRETLDELNIELRSSVDEFSAQELAEITTKFLELHYKHGLGIPLRNDLHAQFHSIYGFYDNNLAQILEFKKKYFKKEDI